MGTSVAINHEDGELEQSLGVKTQNWTTPIKVNDKGIQNSGVDISDGPDLDTNSYNSFPLVRPIFITESCSGQSFSRQPGVSCFAIMNRAMGQAITAIGNGIQLMRWDEKNDQV